MKAGRNAMRRSHAMQTAPKRVARSIQMHEKDLGPVT